MNNKNKVKFLLIALLNLSFFGCEYIGTNSLNYNFYESKKWGVINNQAEVVIENEFKGSISLYNDGFLVQKKGNGKYYFINSDGIESTNSYKELTFFNDGFAFGVLDNKWPVVIDKSGNEIKELEFDKISNFINGMAIVEKDGLSGFIDSNLNLIIKPKYISVGNFSDEGYAFVKTNEEEWRIINSIGEETKLPNSYDNFYHLKDEFLLYKDEERSYGIMKINGEKVIRPNSDWTGLTNFRNGIASYKEDGLWGAINKNGEKVIRAKYNYPLIFNEGLAAAYEPGGNTGFIDKNGGWVIKPEYSWASIFVEGKCLVKKGNSFIIINNLNEPFKNEYKKLNTDRLSLYYVENNYHDYFVATESNHVINFGTVNSDYFDIENVISSLMEFLNIEGKHVLGGITRNTLANSDLMGNLNIVVDEPNSLSNFRYRPTYFLKSNNAKWISDEIGAKVQINYINDIYSRIMNVDEVYDSYRREYVEKEIFSHFDYNYEALIHSISIEFLSSGKTKQKEDLIKRALFNYFEEKFEIIEIPRTSGIGSDEYFKLSNNLAAIIRGNELGIEILLNIP